MKLKFFALLATLLMLPLGAAQAASYTYSGTTDLTNIPQGNVDMQEAGLSTSFEHTTYTGNAGENISSVDVYHGGMVKGTGTAQTSLTTYNNWGNPKTKTYTHSYTQPKGIDANELYLAVFGYTDNNKDVSGSATFAFTKGVTSVSFIWGSIDLYNYLTVTNGNNKTYTISGSDFLTKLGYTADQINGNARKGISSIAGTISAYFTLTDLAGIKSIVLTSCYDSFEVARMSAVPLPGALFLFGSALIGLSATRRRKATL